MLASLNICKITRTCGSTKGESEVFPSILIITALATLLTLTNLFILTTLISLLILIILLILTILLILVTLPTFPILLTFLFRNSYSHLRCGWSRLWHGLDIRTTLTSGTSENSWGS